MQESRRNPRRELALALEIDDVRVPSRHGRMAVSRNISSTGLLVNTPSRFVEGSQVALRVHGVDGRVSTFAADVARVRECAPGSSEPWRYQVALRFRGVRSFDLGVRRKAAALMKLGR